MMVQVDPKEGEGEGEGEGVVVPMTLEEGEKVVTPVVAKKGEKLVVPMDPKEGEGKLDLGGFHDSLLLNRMKMVVEMKHLGLKLKRSLDSLNC